MTETRPAGISRRTLVKAGANAAWAVPVITVATAAPALAVSPGGQLQMGTVRASCKKKQSELHVQVGPIKNAGNSKTQPVQLTMTMPSTIGTNATFKQVSGNWDYTGSSGSSHNFISKGGLNPNQSTGMLVAKFTLTGSVSGKCPGGDVTVVASAPPAAPASSSSAIYEE